MEALGISQNLYRDIFKWIYRNIYNYKIELIIMENTNITEIVTIVDINDNIIGFMPRNKVRK